MVKPDDPRPRKGVDPLCGRVRGVVEEGNGLDAVVVGTREESRVVLEGELRVRVNGEVGTIVAAA